MEDIGEEYKNYWETNMYLQELDMSCLDGPFSSYYDSSSPDGTQSSMTSSKNIVSERNRRRKLNDRLYALRSVVPKISKMDKASIIKDAIEYIKTLHDEEKRIEAEIMELELSGRSCNSNSTGIIDFDDNTFCSKPKRSKLEDQFLYDSAGSPIQVLELRVSNMGEKTMVVSLSCSKRMDTMIKLCEIFESLNLKIITANITAISERLFKTVVLEADEEEKDVLRLKIEAAIAILNDPESPMST